MFKNFIQEAILTIILLSKFVLAKEELLSNSTLPDTKVFNCTAEFKVGKFDSQIDLCSLGGNQFLPQKTSSGEKLSSIEIQRYYCINPFGRIQSTSNHHKSSSYLPNLSDTNCPTYSTSCLVSRVTFQCDNEQDDNDVCLSDQITADSYGYQKKWEPPTAVYPTVSGLGKTAFINMKGGPCYYCSDTKKKLQTKIEFYCDERRTGKGKAMIKQNPTKSIPEVLVQWNTSAACYEFIPKQKCSFRKFFDEYCQPQKPFSCKQEYQYILPRSANTSITSTDSNITYVFGFCAKNVQCSSTDKNVLICKKDGQESKALAYYSDDIEIVARPTGFVMQIKEGGLLGGSLKAVISFECSSESTGDIQHMTVLDSDYLSILLTLEHSCFCPNSQTCHAEDPSESLIKQANPINSDDATLEILMIAFGILCLLVLIFIYVRYRIKEPHNNGVVDDNDGVGVGNTDRVRDGNDGVGNGNDGQPLPNEGDPLLDSPPSTYYSCHSDDTLLSCLSGRSNDLQIEGETPPEVEFSNSQTQESHM